MSAVLDEAMQRLAASLSVLETAAARRLEAERSRADLETELQIMQDDRSRLAVELESASARLGQVEAAAQHVGGRVHQAIGSIREVLSRADPAPPAGT
jgi:chromosome segregation ATPase